MIYFNDRFFEEKIPYKINEGLMFGIGVFETIKITNGKLEFFDMHYERLKYGCDRLNINFTLSRDQVLKKSMNVIKVNKNINGSLKINILKNKEEFDIIITSKNKIYSEKIKKIGYKIIFARNKKFSQNPINYIKSNNYAINILELNRALTLNKNEAIFLNEKDEITEGTISNVFFVKNKEIYTPKLECGLLNGIIRRILVEKFNVKEVIIKDKDIYNFDYAFLSNSLMRIMPIRNFEDMEYNLDVDFLRELEDKIEKLAFNN